MSASARRYSSRFRRNKPIARSSTILIRRLIILSMLFRIGKTTANKIPRKVEPIKAIIRLIIRAIICITFKIAVEASESARLVNRVIMLKNEPSRFIPALNARLTKLTNRPNARLTKPAARFSIFTALVRICPIPGISGSGIESMSPVIRPAIPCIRF